MQLNYFPTLRHVNEMSYGGCPTVLVLRSPSVNWLKLHVQELLLTVAGLASVSVCLPVHHKVSILHRISWGTFPCHALMVSTFCHSYI